MKLKEEAWAIISRCSTGWKFYREDTGTIATFFTREAAREWIKEDCRLNCKSLNPRPVKVRITALGKNKL